MVSSTDTTTLYAADQENDTGSNRGSEPYKATNDVYSTNLMPTTATAATGGGAVVDSSSSVSVHHPQPQPPQPPTPSHNQHYRRRDPIIHPFHDGPSFGPTRYNRNIYALDRSTM